MSQSGVISTSSSPPPPGSVVSLTPDSGAAVVPNGAGTIDVFGGSTSINNINGIETFHGGANELDVKLTNRATGSVTTTGAATSALITLALGAIAGVYTFDIIVSAFAKTGIGAPLGSGYTIVGAARTDGATATLIPTQVVDHFEEGALGMAPQPGAVIAVSGNNVLVNVTGKSDGAAGFVIDWVGTLTYTFAG